MIDSDLPLESQSMTYVLVGLGNPGREYRDTRHNVGFMVIDRLCHELNIRLGRMQSKALIGTGKYENNKVVLGKPQTFMNLSGQAVGELVSFYKIPLSQLLVIHDDLDLPLGTLRIRPGGGSAGQGGLASVIERLGTEDFPRVRIGIDHPPGQMDARDYVLQDFSSAEKDTLDIMLDRAAEAAQSFVKIGLDRTMNRFNGSIDMENNG